jgi:hypothetical protein
MRGSRTAARATALVVALLGGACSFNSDGVGQRPDLSGPVGGDGPAADRRAADQGPRVDGAPDGLPGDTLPAEAPPPPRPITPNDLAAAFGKARVPCMLKNGTPGGNDIPIVDFDPESGLVEIWLHDGSVALTDAPQATKSWVLEAGNVASALVVFNPNSCDDEDPEEPDEEWTYAGLLVRGALVTGSCPTCSLVLAPGATTQDIDLIDVQQPGNFEGSTDFAGVDDADLSKHHKQLEPSINEAKRLIIALGFGF